MLTIDLTGKVALVLGGGRGIGGAITETLCQAGASTVFTHTGNPQHRERVEALAERIRKEGGTVRAAALDARDSTGTAALADQVVRELGKIDVLVFGVGRNLPRPLEAATDEEWRGYIELNLSSAFYAVRAVVPHMVKARYGRIILIGSSAVYDGGGGAIDYASAKAGLRGMMMYLVREYARKGIVTNLVHPCVVDTELLRERYADPEKRAKLMAQVPVGRLGRPQEIAALVAYLASPWGDFICGQEILLDGGRTLFRST